MSGQFLSGPIRALLLVGVEDPQKMGETLDKLTLKLEDEGLQTVRAPLGDREAVTRDASDLGGAFSDYTPGYVVHR